MCASHPSKGTPFGVGWRLMTSHPVAMLVMHNGTFCTTTIVRKNAGTCCACAEHTSGHATSCEIISVRAASGDVTSGSSSSNATLAVLIYCFDIADIYGIRQWWRPRQTLQLLHSSVSNRTSCHTSDNVCRYLQDLRYCFNRYRHGVFDVTLTNTYILLLICFARADFLE
jgi:hypothetical protein